MIPFLDQNLSFDYLILTEGVAENPGLPGFAEEDAFELPADDGVLNQAGVD